MGKKVNYIRPLIIAHRGGEYWKDNDFSYIAKSIQEGADIIELDIALKNNHYIIKHSILSKNKGFLSDALTKIKNNVSIYLDIKDKRIDPNKLIRYVRKKKNDGKYKLIIGSFNKNLLKKIKRDKNITINYHCFSFFCSIKKAKEINASWINPLPYFITKRKIKEIQKSGFRFVPAGSENYEKQLRYAELGAYAISVHKIKEFKNILKCHGV